MSGQRRGINKRMIRAAIPLLIALIGVGSRVISSPGSGDTVRSSGTVAKQPERSTASADRSVGFRSVSQLDSHFQKHGQEFGSISKARYLSMAQDLRDVPLSSSVIEAWQARGNWSRFDRNTGSFIAFRKDKIILTFFKPDDGEDYFRRASARTP